MDTLPNTFDAEDGHEFYIKEGVVTHYAKCDHPLHEPSTFGYSAEADAAYVASKEQGR